ncbi:Amiloride-sensitive sodium channel [Teladorsagia circumcincta]|uniref:Amiloride-sensitive sodium channel n=1 Tax=Teladorsagia circumcincta TaxID=45464 RepID=A0A2G9UWS9_TELCI|nr:Amiloride-sensitive sodium channel [Teladorsagia circumcincta]
MKPNWNASSSPCSYHDANTSTIKMTNFKVEKIVEAFKNYLMYPNNNICIKSRFRFVQYEAVYSACNCVRGPDSECLGNDSVPPDLKSACICNLDRHDGSTWPCYSTSTWVETICPECNDIGYCNVPDSSGNDSIPCVCQVKMGYCVLRSEERLKRVWEFRGKKMPPANSPFRDDFLAHLKKLGYGNMTDQVAITTRAKEKLILKMSSLPPQRRAALGYGKSELIKQCSFNSMQCDIEKEFKLHIDPSFGNCYTFNADPDRVLASSRAGPSYGLRLMVFVNSSDYLPTTEAAGRKVTRLPSGGCFNPDSPLPLGYIYRDYSYEPEGCYRNCYQKRIINQCRCADPRFPKPSDRVNYCDIRNDIIRGAIESKTLNTLSMWAGLPLTCALSTEEGVRLRVCCRGVQELRKRFVLHVNYTENVYRLRVFEWLSENPADVLMLANRIRHAAMLEIYYEQMSYEVLRESESYSIVNLVSDIGGQMGLWLGASVLTAVEIVIFLFNIVVIAITGRLRSDDTVTKEKQAEQTTNGDHMSSPTKKCYDDN